MGWGQPLMVVKKLSLMGLVEAGEALPHEGFSEGRTSSCCVRGTNTTDERALFFSECEAGHSNPPGYRQAGLTLCFLPHPPPLDEFLCRGQ